MTFSAANKKLIMTQLEFDLITIHTRVLNFKQGASGMSHKASFLMLTSSPARLVLLISYLGDVILQ
jgi:hypothetical protein